MPVPSVQIWPALVLLLVAALVGLVLGVFELRSIRKGSATTSSATKQAASDRELRRAA